MAVITYHKSLSPLCDHAAFPFSLTFKVFNLMYMMKFVSIGSSASTQFALFGFEPAFKGIHRASKL